MITAMGIGTKQAPDNVNLDPQSQFWSWLYSYQEPSVSNTANWGGGYIKGFPITQTTPAGMSVQIGADPSGGNDCAVFEYAKGKMTLLSTDGAPQVVTIPTAPASGSRIDSIVTYIDVTSPDPESETPGTPEYVKTVVVSGTAASSPTAPTKEQIQSALPPTVENWYHWADVRVAQGATVITNSNITDKKPASPNLYWTTSEIQGIARTIAQDEAEDVMTQSDNYSDITWYGVHMYIWRRGKVAGLWLNGPISVTIPSSGKESAKIPSWARPVAMVRAPLQFDSVPDYGGTAMVDTDGSFSWAGSGPANTGLYPSLNMSWPIN